jgi:hypothetical protein
MDHPMDLSVGRAGEHILDYMYILGVIQEKPHIKSTDGSYFLMVSMDASGC